MSGALQQGDLVSDRFEVVGLAGLGGMSTVYRAEDRESGHQVALKLLGMTSSLDEARFSREGQLLAELSHPGIVRYVAQGITGEGIPYLAMEWLDGEDLGTRLERAPLTPRESVGVARRAASALAAAHEKGIVHRDIKPSNIFLVDGDPERVKVVDFGLARLAMPSRAMTQTGAVLGTLGYMAPEQARGERDIDARTDVFALGCVLFECLTNRTPFTGKDVVAVLVKILSGKAPRLLELRPDLPPKLDDLVARMMARQRRDRPADGAAVAAEIEALGNLEQTGRPRPSRPAAALSRGEQRLISIILVSLDGRGRDATPDEDTAVDLDLDATMTPEELEDHIAPLRAVAEPRGADVAQMADGTVLVLLKGRSTAADQASRAAACALELLDEAPTATISLATGPAEVTGQWPEGQVIDRAAAVLRGASGCGGDAVFIDEVTAGLLDVRFTVEGDGPMRRLVSQRGSTGARLLLGRRTPCVGRAKELAFLDSLFTECVTEETASAVLVTGAAGVGKSRVQHEFVKRVTQRQAAFVIGARGDPIAAGSPLSLAAQLVRDATGLPQNRLPGTAHAQLRESLAKAFEGEDLQRVAEFLGELCGAPTDGRPSPSLRAARHEARLMTEQMRHGFEEWLGALLERKPVLLVLEDLHWGDQASVSLIGDMLRSHADAPLMVLALARPEINQEFPQLWAESDVQGLHLGAIKRRAAERLVRAVLGDDLPSETIARIVGQAAGNAFYLEELIRHVAEGGDSNFPETVLAIAQSRLDGLDAEVRRVLRAGSIFGEVFWESAVHRLLGRAMSPEEISEWLDVLIEREVLEPSTDERFRDERELVFRHDLLREAAYSTLTKRDRELGHRLAAQWLEEQGERNALALAEHWELGGRRDRAVTHFLDAGQRAAMAGNLDDAMAISARGLQAGAEGSFRGELLLVQTYCHAFRDEFPQTSATAGEALELLPDGSTSWFRALAGLAGAGTWGGDALALMKALQALQGFDGRLAPIGPVGYASNLLHEALVHIGQRAQANQLTERLEAATNEGSDHDPLFTGWLEVTRASRASLGLAPIGTFLPNVIEAQRHFRLASDRVAGLTADALSAYAHLQLGLLDEAVELAQATQAAARERRLPVPEGFATLFLGFAQTLRGTPNQAITTLEPLLTATNPLVMAYGRAELVLALMTADRLEDALREGEAAVNASALFPIANAHALSELAAVEFRLGRAEAALEHVRAAQHQSERNAIDQVAESYLRLTLVEALDATGDHDAALTALRDAKTRIERQAESIEDDAQRDAYLHGLPPNARTFELAQERL